MPYERAQNNDQSHLRHSSRVQVPSVRADAHPDAKQETSVIKERPKSLSIGEIRQAVARAFGLSISEMLSCRRVRHIARARQAAMYLCRELGRRGHLGHRRQAGSFPRIGLAFARDHTSVIYAWRTVAQRRLHDFEIACRLDEVARDLGRPSPTGPPIEQP